MRKLVAFFTVALLLVIASLPVLAQDATPEAEASETPSGTAHFRVVHLTPAANTIVIFRDDNLEDETPGTPVLSGIRRGVATRWIEVPAGTYAFAVGANSNAAAAAFGPVEVTLEDGDFVTLAPVGEDQLTVIEEDFSSLADGTARVTVFHGAEGVDPIDVRAGEEVLVNALAYPGSFFTPEGPMNDGVVSLDVPAGSYDLTVVPNGLTEPVLFDLTGTELEAGAQYLVAAYNGASGPDIVVVPTTRADYLLSIVDTLSANEDFSTLLLAVQAANPQVLEALTGEGPFTVFAPTNEAFAAALEELGVSAAELAADADMVTDVLRYHIVGASGGGELLAAELTDGRGVQTLSGDFIDVTVGADGTVNLNGNISVVQADILATNGVIHVIDGVLMPPTE